MRWLFVHPRPLRAAGRLLWFWQASGTQALSRRLKLTALLPRRVRELKPLMPRIRGNFSDTLIAKNEPARGARRYRVAMLTGCMQDLLFSDVNCATVDVLRENGCEVLTPRAQYCCGSLHAHNGDQKTARFLARRQLEAVDPFAVDAIISNAGGCGSHLRHYDHLLADDPAYGERAREWSLKVRDISEWLVEIGFRAPRYESPRKTSVIYHESCHLCHSQKVSLQPRVILRSIPGVELRESAEGTWCCGSAGIYNLAQPITATWLQQRKVGNLRASGACVVVRLLSRAVICKSKMLLT